MPDPSPTAAHVAAAEAIRSFLQPFVTNTTIQPASIATILAKHFPSPPPVQEFAALAAAIPESYGPWTLDEEHPAVVHGLNDDDTGIAFDSEELARYLVAVQPAAISAMIAPVPFPKAPECPKHPGTKMVYASGTEHHHDLKHPHWRCELWVGSGVCGATRSLDDTTPATVSALIAALGRERARADELHGLIGKAMALRAADATAGEQPPTKNPAG